MSSFTNNAPRCSGPVCFEDTSAGEPTIWEWDFGDGTPVDTSGAPCHDYATAGMYMVSLTASNVCGTGTAFVEPVVEQPTCALPGQFRKEGRCAEGEG